MCLYFLIVFIFLDYFDSCTNRHLKTKKKKIGTNIDALRIICFYSVMSFVENHYTFENS